MKFLLLFWSVLCPLLAQPHSGSGLVDFQSGIVDKKYLSTNGNPNVLISTFKFTWQITRAANGDKTFNFIAYKCTYSLTLTVPFSRDILVIPLPFPICLQVSKSYAEDLGPVQAGLSEFYSLAPGQVAHNVVYGPFAEPAKPHFTIAQPAAAPDPQMIFLDGLSYNLVKFDLTTFAMTSSVTLPPQARAFGVRPTATDPENEVWTAHAGTINEISIADLGSQTVLATIATPSLDPNNSVPVGIVFTNSGLTALYAVAYYTPDSAGNNGVLLVFDVPTRKLRSTLPLKNAPSALLMAPDALTAYLLSSTGNITYYDVLSGTADLTVSTFTPGIGGGYGPPDQVFIHPDGTRLFWNYGPSLVVFDLTTHKIANQFNSGLPMGSALASMQMSQDGSTMWFASALGSVVILDTRYGNILGTFQAMPNGAIFPGPAY